MTSRKSLSVPLQHIRDELDWMEKTYNRMSFEAFAISRLHTLALERSIMIISEAVFRLPDDLLQRHPSINQLAFNSRYRHFIRHQYDDVDHRNIWSVLSEDALLLRPVIAKMILEVSN